jgi:hypothetical protein
MEQALGFGEAEKPVWKQDPQEPQDQGLSPEPQEVQVQSSGLETLELQEV